MFLCALAVVWFEKSVPAASVFDGVPRAVRLPDSTKEDEVTLLPLDLGGKPFNLSLLGGETAIQSKGGAKKKKDAEGAPAELTGYTLTNEGAGCWKIKYNLDGREATCITLTHDGKKLNFKWRTKVPQNLLLPIANCVLKFTCGPEKHYVALREPVKVPNIMLHRKTGAGMIKTDLLDYPLPDLETVFFDLQSLGPHKRGEANVVLPPVKKASELSSREPLKIQFKFKDSNGNTKTPFVLDIKTTIAGVIEVSIEPPLTDAKMYRIMFRQAQDPQIDIVLYKNRSEINSINRKLKKQKAWKRSAKDTNKISRLQTVNWTYEQLRALSKWEAKLRVYINYGETQVNILETQPLTAEQRAARLEPKKPAPKSEPGAPPKKEKEPELKF
ncbi:MAG: hypothetical protein K6C40_03830 [Thermoguttaceae bacterium]|nr:hypothetical protein [Thermoguttaceae bacterium]